MAATVIATNNKKGLIWMGVALLIIMIILWIIIHGTTAMAVSGNKPLGTTARGSEIVNIEPIQPSTRKIEVGTNWYHPNVEMLHVHVWGHPLVPDVKWQMRYNYDDSTIISMPPINCPQPTFVDLEIPNIVAIEYRVDPNDRLKQCGWIFQFGPPQN